MAIYCIYMWIFVCANWLLTFYSRINIFDLYLSVRIIQTNCNISVKYDEWYFSHSMIVMWKKNNDNNNNTDNEYINMQNSRKQFNSARAEQEFNTGNLLKLSVVYKHLHLSKYPLSMTCFRFFFLFHRCRCRSSRLFSSKRRFKLCFYHGQSLECS